MGGGVLLAVLFLGAMGRGGGGWLGQRRLWRRRFRWRWGRLLGWRRRRFWRRRRIRLMVNLGRWFKHLFMPPWAWRRAFPQATLDAIEAAIRQSETRHNGEIRFAIETSLAPARVWRGMSGRERAIEVFSELRVWDTEHNSGVLIYLLLADHDIEIVADRGIAAQVEQSAWERGGAGDGGRLPARRVRARRAARHRAGERAAGERMCRRASSNPNELANRPVISQELRCRLMWCGGFWRRCWWGWNSPAARFICWCMALRRWWRASPPGSVPGVVVQLLTAAVIAGARHTGPAPLVAQHRASRMHRAGYGYRPAGADRFLAGRSRPGQISRCAVGCRGRIGQRRQRAAADHSCSQRQYAGSRQLITKG